jgi:predicted cupin superfamily sugar epimerase
MKSADDWIETLKLIRHPEGGFFREIYRAGESIAANALPSRYAGPRPFSTSIFFLLKSGQVSHFHRLQSDEIWHFYEGGSVVFHVFDPSGAYRRFRLGRNPDAGEAFQAVLPRAAVFGAEVARPRSFALCGCTVAPGFDFADFAFVRREELSRRFPERASVIERLAVP